VKIRGRGKLFQNDITPGPNSVVADFTEANFGSYASVTLSTWGAPYVDVDGIAKVSPPSSQFQPDDSDDPNTIYGFYVTQAGAPTVLLYAARLDTPVPLVTPADALILIAAFPFIQG